MKSGENGSFTPKLPERLFHRARERTFEQRIYELNERAHALKVGMHIATEIDGEVTRADPTIVFGASIGKLPLADMAINLLYSDEVWEIGSAIVDRTGGGAYDQVTTRQEATTAELLDDMLRNSGNTAYRVLARGLGGPDAINGYFENKGWFSEVGSDPVSGRAVLGETSAEEAMMQMKEVLNGTTGDKRLRERARFALNNSSATDQGIRRYAKNTPDLQIFNKTGRYNGDEDDPLVFRHDVGFVKGSRRSISYAVLTSSPMRMRGVVASAVVSQFGAEVAREAGGPDVISLGSRALRFVL